MKILQISHRLPFPLIDGGKKGIYGFTSGFHQHPAVKWNGLISIAPDDERNVDLTTLQNSTDMLSVHYKHTKNRIMDLARNSLLSKLPYTMEKYIFADVLKTILDTIRQQRVDLVHFDHLHTAYYAMKVRESFPDVKIVLREHNVESTILERLAQTSKNPANRAVYALQAKRLQTYEADHLARFDLVLPITDVDTSRVCSLTPTAQVLTLPAGSDVPERQLRQVKSDKDVLTVLHIAAMDWIPNQDGLRWFLREVLPLLEKAVALPFKLHVVGKNMPKEFLDFRHPLVVVHGFVDDLTPLLKEADLAVVPLHVGGGMRVKILDYMANGIPVVSTSVGAEGITGGDTPFILIGDGVEGFASATANLLSNPTLREQLRNRAFDEAKSRYTWAAIVDRLVAIYADLIKGNAVAA